VAQTKPPSPKPDRHPLIAALDDRGHWEPRPFTRTISRVSAGTRAVSSQVNPLELAWREIGAAALDDDLPIWVVLGDSIAQGVGATDITRSWVSRIAGALAADGRPHGVVNLSRSGARSRSVIHQQLALLDRLDRPPALITCGVGSNDLMRNPHPPSVSARVNELIDELPSTTIISTLPVPAVSPSGRWVNRSVRRQAQRRGLPVADVVPHLVTGRRGWAADRFHPSDAGYNAWVEAYSEVLDLDREAVPEKWDPAPPNTTAASDPARGSGPGTD
jgi:acyl-CoA thioesterase I